MHPQRQPDGPTARQNDSSLHGSNRPTITAAWSTKDPISLRNPSTTPAPASYILGSQRAPDAEDTYPIVQL
jgi:hypothetical protein